MTGSQLDFGELCARITLIENRVAFLESASVASDRLGVGRGTKPERQRQDALFEHDLRWNGVKDRWPAFVVHPRACEAFERHVVTLEGEPTLERLQKIADRMGTDSAYPRQKFESVFKCSAEKAAAYIYFLKISGLATYIWRKGLQIKE